jgi:hypothetical protein
MATSVCIFTRLAPRHSARAFAVSMSHPLYNLLRKLEDAKIHFTLGRHREDTVLVTLALLGERVEVDVFEDGHMEVSRFPGSEDIVGGQELVDELIRNNAD